MRLNAEQRRAVEHSPGALLVIAGAGSGKTRVITARIARILKEGQPPESILGVTFTNKAAAEMRERLARLCPRTAADRVWLSTFHSFGMRFLREEAKRLGLHARFTIYDQGDSIALTRELLQRQSRADRSLDAAAVYQRISIWKSRLWAPADVVTDDTEYDNAAKDIYGIYEETLASMHAVDFDGLITKPVEALRDRPAVREKWEARFKHVLVDEFQDTDDAQLELVRWLSGSGKNLCVVGDDDQSIYGWRGANANNIREFEKHFKGATVIKLEQNYRSTGAILNIANAAIEGGGPRPYRKVLRPTRDGGDRVRRVVLPDPDEEVRFVAREIRALLAAGTTADDIGVLYRASRQARLLEEELRVAGVQYRVFGGTKIFDRKDVKDGVHYLRVALNPYDELSLRRIINMPARGLGPRSVSLLAEFAAEKSASLFTALKRANQVPDLSPRAVQSAAALHAALVRARAGFDEGEATESSRRLFEETGLLHAEGPTPAHTQKKREHLEFLLRSISRLEAREGKSKKRLRDLLHYLALGEQDEEASQQKGAVTLSSLHAAKGLEYEVVFLVGCVEGILPHGRTIDPKVTDAILADLDEERRLFYVGVTRAKSVLYLSRYRERVSRGRLVEVAPSRFLEGLPEESVHDYVGDGATQMASEDVADMAQALLDRLAAV